MELTKLRYFYEVAKSGHVTKAAENISIAQPALTQAIKSLERELDVPLLERKGRNIALTEYGAHLKSRLDQILPQIDVLPQELLDMKQQTRRTVRLNILAATNFVVDAVVAFRGMHPQVIFDFEQNTHKRVCDLVVSTNGTPVMENPHLLKRRCIKEERIYLAVPRNSIYASMETVDLIQLQNEGFIMMSAYRQFGVVCHAFCSSVGFVPRVIFESDSPAAVQNVVSAGIGVAFWPEYSWGPVKNSNIILLPIGRPICQRELIMELYQRPVESVYAEAFFDYLLSRYSVQTAEETDI